MLCRAPSVGSRSCVDSATSVGVAASIISVIGVGATKLTSDPSGLVSMNKDLPAGSSRDGGWMRIGFGVMYSRSGAARTVLAPLS